MSSRAHGEDAPGELLIRSIRNDRVHAAYLLTGTGAFPTATIAPSIF